MFPIVERLEWLERVSDPADPFGGSEVLDRFEQSETVERAFIWIHPQGNRT